MFWKRKKSQQGAEDERSAGKMISDEDVAKLADRALESIAGLVRIFGEKSFDIEGATARETQEACERWARHIMVGSPAHPSHERVEAAGEPEAADEAEAPARADDSEARADDSKQEGDSNPPPILRDFVNLLRFVGSQRGREQGYVTESLSDLRLVIWNMVQNLRGSVSSDREADGLATEQLRRLGVAVEGHSTEKIRRARLASVFD